MLYSKYLQDYILSSYTVLKAKLTSQVRKSLLKGFGSKRAPPAQTTSFPDRNVYLS